MSRPGPLAHDRLVDLLGVGVDALGADELEERIEECIAARAHALVLNVNVHCLNLSFEEPWLRDFLNHAELVFCDGSGVRLGAWLTGQWLPERITYADWLPRLAAFLAARGRSLFLLGGEPGVAEEAAARLGRDHPGLVLAGSHHGYFDKHPEGHPNRVVVERIRAAAPDVLLVAFGMPLQERWLLENWDRIEARVALTGGAALDYLTGRTRRGPRLLVDNHMEWLARLWVDPARLWRRYLVGNPRFLWRLFRWHALGWRP